MTFKKYDIVKYDDFELSIMRLSVIVPESGRVFGVHALGTSIMRELHELKEATEEEKEFYRMHERRRSVPTLDYINRELLSWQEITFPNATAETCLAHLKSEMIEFLESGDLEELADIRFLSIAYANKLNVNLAEIEYRKLLICFDRKWETKVNEAGYFGHIDEDS